MENKEENNTPRWKRVFVFLVMVFIILVVFKQVSKTMDPQSTTMAPFFYDYYEE